MSHTRFLTGTLASLAVASAVTLATPTAYAADEPVRPCGLAAVPAVFQTVIHEPVLREVPAVTHDEFLWERDVTTYEHEYSKVLSPAHTETDWTRELPGTTEYLWSHKIVDQVAVAAAPGTPEQGHYETVVVTPAVTELRFEYLQQQTGRTRWESADWNASNIDTQGWYRTGRSRDEVVTPEVTAEQWVVDQAATSGTPAVDEVSHTETTWSASSPGADWSGPTDERTVSGGTESVTTTDDEPAGAGWAKKATRDIPAVIDTLWALDAPEGYTPTGETRLDHVTHEQTEVPSAAAPAGDGWSKVADSAVQFLDEPATTEIEAEGYTEEVLVTPAIPASEACVAAPEDDTHADGGNTVTVAAPAAVSSAQSEGPASVAGPAAGTATVLPATGNPASPLLLATGIGALLAGGSLVRVGRRRRTA